MKAKRLERFTENVSLRRNERLETMGACGIRLFLEESLVTTPRIDVSPLKIITESS